MATYTHRIMFWLCCAFATILGAQGPSVSFEHFTYKNGLVSNEVSKIVNDHRGFLWVGTTNGLSRFDGQHFKNFQSDPNDSAGVRSLAHILVEGLAVGSDGAIWICANGFVIVLDPVTEKFKTYELPNIKLGKFSLGSVFFDQKGFAWVAAAGEVYRFDPKTMQVLQTYPFPMPNDTRPVCFFTEDKNGQLFAVSIKGLYRYDRQQNRFDCLIGAESTAASNRYEPQFTDAVWGADGRLWASAWGKGLFAIDPATGNHQRFAIDEDNVTALAADVDAAGKPFFWVGGGPGGLAIFRPETAQFQYLNHVPDDETSTNGKLVRCFFRDKKTGMLWMGATDGGLQKYDPLNSQIRKVKLPFYARNKLAIITGFIQDNTEPSGEVFWMIHQHLGLLRWDRRNGQFARVTATTLSKDTTNYAWLQQATDGTIWTGFDSDVARIHPQKVKWKQNQCLGCLERVAKAQSMTGCIDLEDRIWLGHRYFEGIQVFDTRTGQFVFPGGKPAIEALGKGQVVTCFWETADQKMWIGMGNGPALYDFANGKALKTPPDFATIGFINGLVQDQNGMVWMTSWGNVYKVSPSGEHLETYGPTDGVMDNHEAQIVADAFGNVWCGTTNGLYRMDGPSMRHEHPLRCFTEIDGLWSNNTIGGLFLSRAGDLLVGSTDGFSIVPTNRIRSNQVAPPLAITGLKILGKNRIYIPGETIILQPGENSVTLEFAALNFTEPGRNHYQYWLEGLDADWGEYVANPTATYTNLDGNYTFHVRAFNNDGVASAETLDIKIKALPVFYKTWWFWAAIFAVMASIAGWIYYQRRLGRLAMMRVRDRISKDLHDEIGSTLTSVHFMAEAVKFRVAGASPEVVPFLEDIGSTALGMIETMREMVWVINPLQDKVENFLVRLNEYAYKTTEAKEVRFALEIDDAVKKITLSPDQKKNILLICKEAINNAIKYSDCTAIAVSFEKKGNQLEIKISDNGKGFDPVTNRRGNGLNNMESRAKEINGVLSLNSTVGNGCNVLLVVGRF